MSEKDLEEDFKEVVCDRVKDFIYFANGREEENYDWILLEKTWWLLVQDSRSKAHPEVFGNAMTFAEQVGLTDDDFFVGFGKRKFRSFFENHPMLCVHKFYGTSVVTIMEMDDNGEPYSANKPVFTSPSALVSKTEAEAVASQKLSKRRVQECMKLKMMIQKYSPRSTLREPDEIGDNNKENCQSVSGENMRTSTDTSPKLSLEESPVPELRDFDEIEDNKTENCQSVSGEKRKESTDLSRKLSFPPSTRPVLQENDGIDDKNKENCHSARGKKQKTTKDASPNISFQRAFSMFATTPSESNMKQTVESLENELKENDTPNILLHFTQVINNSLNPTTTVNKELKMELYALAHKILQIKKQSIENASQLLTASSP